MLSKEENIYNSKNFSSKARYLEYNNNVIPTNSKQHPMKISLDDLNCEYVVPPSKIFNFNNDNLPEYIQPATSPNLSVSYIKIMNNFKHSISNSSSNVFYVIKGSGLTKSEFGDIEWSEGDIFILPYNMFDITHNTSDEEAILLWANDSPLLKFLGSKPTTFMFSPVMYRKSEILKEMTSLNNTHTRNNNNPRKNRNGLLLTNPEMMELNLNTLTHTMWSLYNSIAPNTVQKPHRHNSVAIDYCIDADPNGNTYTLMGEKIDDDGNIINPEKLIWKKGAVFTTPPGWWHSHHNESNITGLVFPIQDAGLHTYMNTLDIQFIL